MKEGFKRVSVEGLPTEDGSYIILQLLQEHRPQLFVRYTEANGFVKWTGIDSAEIQQDDISMYKRVLITPEGL